MRENRAVYNVSINRIHTQHGNLRFVGNDLLLVIATEETHDAVIIEVHDAD